MDLLQEMDEDEFALGQGSVLQTWSLDNKDDDNGLFSPTQLITMQVVSMWSAFLSLIGSSMIIYDILCSPSLSSAERKANSKSMYKRLLLGLSFLDMIVDVGHYIIFGPFFSVPVGVDYVFAPQGNWTTCSISGFFLHFTTGIFFYSSFLAIYFALVIRFEIKEDKMKQRIEPFMHCIAIGFPIASGIYAVQKRYMNPIRPMPGTCWVSVYPPECMREDLNVPCDRGEDSALFGLVTCAMTVVLSFITNVVCFVLVIRKVCQTERKSQRHSLISNFSPMDLDLDRSSHDNDDQEDHQFQLQHQQQRIRTPAAKHHPQLNGCIASHADGFVLTREITIQSLLYITAFLITYFPLVTVQVIALVFKIPGTRANRSIYFPATFLAKFLTPMQGVMNCFIYYFRKRNVRRISRKRTSIRRSNRLIMVVRDHSSGLPSSNDVGILNQNKSSKVKFSSIEEDDKLTDEWKRPEGSISSVHGADVGEMSYYNDKVERQSEKSEQFLNNNFSEK